MKSKAIYQRVFDEMRDSGLLDAVKDRVNAPESRAYGENYMFTWSQHVGLWRKLNRAYGYSIPLPSLKKFRTLVETYCQ